MWVGGNRSGCVNDILGESHARLSTPLAECPSVATHACNRCQVVRWGREAQGGLALAALARFCRAVFVIRKHKLTANLHHWRQGAGLRPSPVLVCSNIWTYHLGDAFSASRGLSAQLGCCSVHELAMGADHWCMLGAYVPRMAALRHSLCMGGPFSPP